MVLVARSVVLSVVVAAAIAVHVQATPLELNPYTPVELNSPLTASHPAYGAKPNDDCVKPIIPTGPNDAAYRKLREMEDSYSDIDDLGSYFGGRLEVDFTTLKNQFSYASAPNAPWPGSYWPTFQDGINHVWKGGEACASEKYAKAYGLDVEDFKNKISANNGVDSRKSSSTCSRKSDCASGSECAKRDRSSTGYCIPSWYGICHAWAPAALLEQEPKCNVELNGVKFHVMDIKALLTEVYDGADIPTVFTGARFNGPDSPSAIDQYRRFTDATRRDMGAGFFHIAISNIMGKHQHPFIIDVAADSEVWNQPVWSYNVESMEIIDTAEACGKHFGTTSYPFNSAMVQLAQVKTTVTWAVEAYVDGPLVSTGDVDNYLVSNEYEYLLELDANDAIIGGEWVGDSKEAHPDFLWFATGKPDTSTVTSVGLSYADVQELLELSLACNSTSSLPTGSDSIIPDSYQNAPSKTEESGKNSGKATNGDNTNSATTSSSADNSFSSDSSYSTGVSKSTSTSGSSGSFDASESTSTSGYTTTSNDAYDSSSTSGSSTGADTEGDAEVTPVPTTPEQQQESTPAPESTPTTDYNYGTPAPDVTVPTEVATPAPITEGDAEVTPVPTTPEQQQESTPAPEPTPTTHFNYGTPAPDVTVPTEVATPAPITEGDAEVTPVPTTPEQQQESTPAPESTPTTDYNYGTVTIPRNQIGTDSLTRSDQGVEEVPLTDIRGENTRSLDYPSQEHKMCE
ncbi:hypothetical protein PRNP1_012142 [Phytophthora ramorum]